MKWSAALLLALTASLFADGIAVGKSRCDSPDETRGLARNHYYRVYADDDALVTYACDRHTGKLWDLGDEYFGTGGDSSVRLVTLVGPVIAWQVVAHDYYTTPITTSSTIGVADFIHRRGDHRHYLGGQGYATALVVNRRMSIAWIERRPIDPPSGHFRALVRRIDSRGAKVLDAGRDAHAPRRLRLHGSTLRWERDGVEATASLR